MIAYDNGGRPLYGKPVTNKPKAIEATSTGWGVMPFCGFTTLGAADTELGRSVDIVNRLITYTWVNEGTDPSLENLEVGRYIILASENFEEEEVGKFQIKAVGTTTVGEATVGYVVVYNNDCDGLAEDTDGLAIGESGMFGLLPEDQKVGNENGSIVMIKVPATFSTYVSFSTSLLGEVFSVTPGEKPFALPSNNIDNLYYSSDAADDGKSFYIWVI